MMNNKMSVKDWVSQYVSTLDMARMLRQPIQIISPDGIVRYVNRAWLDTYHLLEENVLNRHISDIIELRSGLQYYLSFDALENIPETSFNHFDEPVSVPACLLALEKKDPVSMVTQAADGSQIAVRSIPIFDAQNQVVMVITIVQDLSLMAVWQEALERERQKNRQIRQELEYLRANQPSTHLVGISKEMEMLRSLISYVAKSDANVLITGESGVGKEVVAKEIHSQSPRHEGPYISANCAAIPENLLESELFGYEKGAFTGAYKSKAGLFELANGGTLMLDEIGELSLHLQPKLLRALQEREICRVGGTKSIPVDIRIIAATNQNLMDLVNAGQFRSDLFYRLNVVPLKVPPLRKRRKDISVLATSFLERYNEKYHMAKYFQSQALLLLEQQDWPGNVRELENVVERLIVVNFEGDNAITATQVHQVLEGDLETGIFSGESTEFTLKTAVDGLERKLIADALSTHKSTYKAAKVLGVSQSTLVRKIKALGIQTNKT